MNGEVKLTRLAIDLSTISLAIFCRRFTWCNFWKWWHISPFIQCYFKSIGQSYPHSLVNHSFNPTYPRAILYPPLFVSMFPPQYAPLKSLIPSLLTLLSAWYISPHITTCTYDFRVLWESLNRTPPIYPLRTRMRVRVWKKCDCLSREIRVIFSRKVKV